MVLDIFVEGCDDSMSCQYSGFGKFRCEILKGWNEELGKLYQEKYGCLWNRDIEFGFLAWASILTKTNEIKSIDDKMKKILEEYDKPYNEGMKIFFYHSDCDGEINPAECELVLTSFNRVDPEKFDKSNEEINEWLRESYNTWIVMLKYAIENNKPIIFG